jgi:hypothetical protein
LAAVRLAPLGASDRLGCIAEVLRWAHFYRARLVSDLDFVGRQVAGPLYRTIWKTS